MIFLSLDLKESSISLSVICQEEYKKYLLFQALFMSLLLGLCNLSFFGRFPRLGFTHSVTMLDFMCNFIFILLFLIGHMYLYIIHC